MTYESLKMFGLDHIGVDENKSYSSYDPNTLNHTIYLYLLKDINLKCPYCTSSNISVKGTRKNNIRYSYGEFKNIMVVLHRRTYYCGDCSKSFSQRNPISINNSVVSLSKELAIVNALKDKTKTFSFVANEFNVSVTYVQKLFDSWVELDRLQLPIVLCIDEVYAKKLTYKSYCCVLYSPQTRSIIDILPSRHKLKLIDYFAHISNAEKSRVKYISMDLWDSYRQMAKLCLPNAIICADSFHVIKHLCDCFKKIRIKVMRSMEGLKHEKHNYYWLFKKYNYFLMKDLIDLPEFIKIRHSNMQISKYKVIDEMLNLSDELKAAYELKEEYRNFNSSATIDNAKEWLDELIIKFKSSRIPDYIPFWSLLQNWHDEIINSFNRINGHRISNGPMERVNRDIKTILGISFGCTNFNRVRNRIMFSLNPNSPILGTKKSKK
jgi:transposase